MTDIAVRDPAPGDWEQIADVVTAAFADHGTVAAMVRELLDTADFRADLAFVARRDTDVVGFTMLVRCALIDEKSCRRQVVTLTPLAVSPAYQRTGIGSTLVRAALAAADRAGEPVVILEGDPRYYGQLGFRSSTELGISITLPEWAPAAAAQAFPLTAYDPSFRGHVVYPAAVQRASDQGHAPADG